MSHDPYAPQDPPVIEARLIQAVEAAKAAETTPAGQSADPAVVNHVPKGTSAVVLAWVGEDKERAQLALNAENAHKPRKGLVEELTEILGK